MATKNIKEEEVKSLKTVPLRDVIYVTIILANVVGMFILGWFCHNNYINNVKADAVKEAAHIIQLSKSSE